MQRRQDIGLIALILEHPVHTRMSVICLLQNIYIFKYLLRGILP